MEQQQEEKDSDNNKLEIAFNKLTAIYIQTMSLCVVVVLILP